MAKHLDKFTAPFQDSDIPFVLAEVVTNGAGDMVNLVCRYANSPAAALVGIPAETLRNQRFTRLFPAARLSALQPLQKVAFSGSSISFSYTTLLGHALTVTCYQPVYGLVGCLLDPCRSDADRDGGSPLMENLPGAAAVLELGRNGAACFSFNQRLCRLLGRTRKELLDLYGGDFSSLVDPADWPDLLQELLDAGRAGRTASRDFRLLRRDGSPLWVSLQAEVLSVKDGVQSFCALFLDVDRQRRDQACLAETLKQLESVQRQLNQLFDSLPANCCVFRFSGADTAPALVQVSRGLADLLGETPAELRQHLALDPLWGISADDREELAAAAVRARRIGAPLQHLCRVQPKSGGLLHLSIKAVWQDQPDGSRILYAACSNVTREQETETKLQIQTQLSSLLLDGSHGGSFDYEPATDVIRMELCSGKGRLVSRTVFHYLAGLKDAPSIHPEDRKPFAAALRRAVARPGTGSLEYRGDYDGGGWRWYKASWVSLFDGRGNVYRLLGKTEDISSRKAAEERFRDLTQWQKRQERTSLLSLRLDLTANRILDARSKNSRLTQVFRGNTADECLLSIARHIPLPAKQAEFQSLFQRESLLLAFQRGAAHFGLGYPLLPEGAGTIWVRTMLELAQNPATLHLEAFCLTLDIDGDWQHATALDALCKRDYDFVLTVDAASGRCRAHGRAQETLPPNAAYRNLLAALCGAQPPSRQRAAIRKALRLETVLAALETADRYEFHCVIEAADGAPVTTLQWSWLDRQRGLLLFTGRKES